MFRTVAYIVPAGVLLVQIRYLIDAWSAGRPDITQAAGLYAPIFFLTAGASSIALLVTGRRPIWPIGLLIVAEISILML